jgi:hypothetical protein
VNRDGNASVGVVGKLQWVQCAWHAGLELLHDDWGECDGAIVIWAYHLALLGHWDNGGLLEAGGDYSLRKGKVLEKSEKTHAS